MALYEKRRIAWDELKNMIENPVYIISKSSILGWKDDEGWEIIEAYKVDKEGEHIYTNYSCYGKSDFGDKPGQLSFYSFMPVKYENGQLIYDE